MRIIFTAIDPQGYQNEFSGDLPTPEACFNFLSKIVSRGHTLLRAELVDEDQRTSLPVAAFDGVPFSEVLQTLQEEWQAILRTAYCQDVIHDSQVCLAQYGLQQCELRIMHHQRMLSWAKAMLSLKPTKEAIKFHGHYETTVTYHQKALVIMQLKASLRQARLDQLLA